MVTMKEIADLAGVSRATVDRVLNKRGLVKMEKAERIQKIADELGYRPNIAGRGLASQKKRLRFGLYYPNLGLAPFYDAVIQGARQEAENLKQYGVTVVFHMIPNEFLTRNDTVLDFESDFGNIDGLVTIGGNTKSITNMLRRANKKSIPVVLYNMDNELHCRLAVVRCNYVESGRLAAGLTAALTNQKGHVAIFSLDNGNLTSFLERLQGFNAELHEHYPEMKIISVNDMESGDSIDREKFYQKACNVMAEHKDINAVYIINPGDYQICRILRAHAEKRNLKIITNDLTDAERKMVKDGTIDVTICQEPEKQGELPLRILYNFLALGIRPKQETFYTELSIHISQNV